MSAKKGDGGRSTRTAQRSIYAKFNENPITPSGGAVIQATIVENIQDVSLKQLPPLGGDETTLEGQDQAKTTLTDQATPDGLVQDGSVVPGPRITEDTRQTNKIEIPTQDHSDRRPLHAWSAQGPAKSGTQSDIRDWVARPTLSNNCRTVHPSFAESRTLPVSMQKRLQQVPTRYAHQQQKPSRHQPLSEARLLQLGLFTKQERREIANADEIQFEERSQDTSSDCPKTKHGYTKDDFVEDTDDELQSEDSEEDDTESCALGTDCASDESDEEPTRRKEVVTHLMKKYPSLGNISSEHIDTIVLKRRTGRTRYMEMILNSWIARNVSLCEEDICLFLKLITMLPQECCNEIYANLARSIKRRSIQLYKLVFLCIKHYWPEQVPFFKAIHKKNKTLPAKAAEVEKEKKRAKPTVPKPVLRSIEDIGYVTFTFLNEFKRYEHDYSEAGYKHSSLFGCLTPDQQSTMCSMTKQTISSIEAMDTETQLDLFRNLFGLKSSAAVIDALQTLEFTGNAIEPSDWAVYMTSFQKILNLAPRRELPSDAELAKRFIYACPLKLLRQDVQARKPSSLACAMTLILDRINDTGFMRSLVSKTLKMKPDRRDRRIAERPMEGSQALTPFGAGPRHTQFQNGLQGNFPKPQSARTDNLMIATPPPTQLHRASLHVRKHDPCERCKKLDGHTKSECISKHDVDGKRLEPLESSVYQQNKIRYFKLKDSVKNAVEQYSSATSDEHVERSSDIDDADCVCSLVPCTADDIVPAPSLLLDGDIEANPGPSTLPDRRAKAQDRQHRTHLHKYELLACIIIQHGLSGSISVLPQQGPLHTMQHQGTTSVLIRTMPLLLAVALLMFNVSHDTKQIQQNPARDSTKNRTHRANIRNDISPYSVRNQLTFLGYEAPVPSLLIDGDIEANPGPPRVPDLLLPTLSSDDDDDCFQPSQPIPRPQEVPINRDVDITALVSRMDTPSNTKDTSDSSDNAYSSAVMPTYDSDSSVTSDPDIHDTCALHSQGPDLLPPPKFIGFLCNPSVPAPPSPTSATICAIDTMCLGDYSIISQKIVTTLNLPTAPFQRTSRTATGAIVKCTMLSSFNIMILIKCQWHTIPCKALVWDNTSQPLLLCNTWALSTGLIDMVQPNATRCDLFGSPCFDLNWEASLKQADSIDLCAYHEDVMNESDDDIVDLSAPLKVGDQDISSLSPDARSMALRFPSMTKSLPFHAHPDLEKWRAHIVYEDLAKYSWPKCDLQDLKEDKFPTKVLPAIHAEFDKLIAQGFAEELRECPTSVVMKAQLVAKSKTERRFCVNGSQQKKVLRVGVYPMPNIRNIFAFVAAFKWRAKVDLKWGYYNFEVHEDDRKWTVTIGGGRAIQWRKLVQGFASSGAFFQYAMSQLLGTAIVGKIAEVYLDDLIIVGSTEQECAENVDIIMHRLNDYNFRVNFAKCQFTPSTTIDFLGCRLVENVVHPGPKVGLMLQRIQPFYLQHTPKSQRHHLHVFLGMCAYLLNHCPGLKQALHPLYLAVASDPFSYTEVEKSCFRSCHAMLGNLNVYHLPSTDEGYLLEVHSDASGGSGTKLDPGNWGAVLGQRRNVAHPIFAEGFELIQLDGGSFNERQAKWDILKKEMYALYRAIKSFRHFIFARHFRIIVDSKVLLLMHRSSVSMIQRWYAYIQSHSFELIHFASDRNCLADGLTRCVQVLPNHYNPPNPRLVGIEPNPGPEDVTILSSDTSISSLQSCPEDAPLDTAISTNVVTRSGITTNISTVPTHDYQQPALASPTQDVLPALQRASLQKRHRRGTTFLAIEPAADANTANIQPVNKKQLDQSVTTVPRLVTPAPKPDLPWPTLLQFMPTATQSPTSVTIQCIRHKVDESDNSFFVALAQSLDHSNFVCPETFPRNHYNARVLRETITSWMKTNAIIQYEFFHNRSPHHMYEELYQGSNRALMYNKNNWHQPSTWNEYIHYMLSDTTQADEVVLKCAALHLRVQIIVTVQNHGTHVFAPTQAFRRVHLLFSPRFNHFGWCHQTEELCSNPSNCHTASKMNVSLDAPPVTSIPNANLPHRIRLGDSPSITSSRRNQISQAHNGFTGHPGIQATLKLLHDNGHTWRGMTAQVTQFISQCPTCVLSRIRLNPARAAASSLRLFAPALRRWHIDSTGSLEPCVHTGYTRIILYICESTGYTVLQGSRFGSALEMVLGLVSIIGTFGLFESFHTDGGPENDAYVLHQFQRMTGLKHTASIPCNPQTNGLAERAIQNIKRFLRCLISDGVSRHNSWGLMLPIIQRTMNSSPCSPLGVSPDSIIFASLYTPDSFVIPATYLDSPQGTNLADGNHYPPNANFVTRATYFQQHMVNRRHEILLRATREAEMSPSIDSHLIAPGTQVLIPWPHNRPPSSLHPIRRGPYIVTHVHGNILSLYHAISPVPDRQQASLRWSRQAQVFLLESALNTLAVDPSAANTSAGPPTQRAIECVLSFSLIRTFNRDKDPDSMRLDVRNQLYVCRIFATVHSPEDMPNWRKTFSYEEIRHTLAFDTFIANHPFLTGHVPTASMPLSWNPRAVPPPRRPAHEPVLDAERIFPLSDHDDISDPG